MPVRAVAGQTGRMLPPPVWPGDMADPSVLADPAGEAYWAFATEGPGSNVKVLTSPDLVDWLARPDALPVLASWAQPGFTWSPSARRFGDRYLLHYAVREPVGGRQAISVAEGTAPGGPYVDASTAPLVYQVDLGGSIDPSPFVDVAGTHHLLWKSDANAIGATTSLWIQQLSPDGLGLVGEATRLLDHGAAWEGPLIEAPSLVRHEDRYYLFYSANAWNTARYAIGYAVAAHLRGPYRKITRHRPWFAGDRGVAGPGGQEFFVDRTGVLRMAYHGWDPAAVAYRNGGSRRLRLATVTFAGGRPGLAERPPRWWRR